MPFSGFIFIFCNPWSKKRHKKRRLTHTRQLLKYREFLADNGEIYFKTDDDELFEESFEYFEQAGFEIVYQTRDLHHSDYFLAGYPHSQITITTQPKIGTNPTKIHAPLLPTSSAAALSLPN